MTWRVCLQVHDSLVLRNGREIINADYKALEITIMADLCLRLFQDRQLADMTAPGAPDVHAVNALMVFGKLLQWRHPSGTPLSDYPVGAFKEDAHCKKLRHLIKIVMFGLFYGKSGYGFSTIEGPDGRPLGEERADEMVEALFTAIPGLALWQSWCREFVGRYRGIYSLGGRWCPLREESAPGAPEWLRNRGYRRAYNFPLQASGAEIVGDAMIRVGADRRLMGCGTEAAEQFLAEDMTAATANGTPLLVPLQVSINHGRNYYEASKG